MRAPLFWYTSPPERDWRATALRPFGAMFAVATARRLARGRETEFKADVPVICIGNINVGGTGKTPTAIALAQRIGTGVHVVSRGYGGTETGPMQVKERLHSAQDVGDEPLLLAAFAPTWVARDRAAGVRAAIAAGARVVLLDDGFQNPAVAKDLSIVVVDARRGFGNGLCLPAGPLREPVSVGLGRADLVLAIGSEEKQSLFDSVWGETLNRSNVPLARAELVPLQTGMDWQGLPVLAFAGIGDPAKFFSTLKGLGADLKRGEALQDHQPLDQRLMLRLEAEAKLIGAQLVTTEKDAVRLPRSFQQKVLTLPVRLQPQDWRPIDTALENALQRSVT